jgi:hypothetical protein
MQPFCSLEQTYTSRSPGYLWLLEGHGIIDAGLHLCFSGNDESHYY